MTIKTLGLVVVVALATAGCKKSDSSARSIKVAAAADLAFAFEELGAAFEKQTGTKVTFTFGSTGQLAKQISEGAPYDVFAAANVTFVDEVVEAKACDPATKALYGRGRVVAWTKQGSVAPPAALADLVDPRFVKIAIANPEHAPYGKAAKQALQSAGIWEQVESKIVYGENVRQTLQFAETGNAEVAIAALSLAKVTKDGVFLVIDEKLHQPIDQALVVCQRGGHAELAKAFAAYVSSEVGRTTMRRFGFVLPGETVAETK